MQVKFRYDFRCVDNLWLKIAKVLLELVEKMLGQNKKNQLNIRSISFI